jgi:hypothetical protein
MFDVFEVLSLLGAVHAPLEAVAESWKQAHDILFPDSPGENDD